MSLDYDYYREPYAVERVELFDWHGNLVAHCRCDDGHRLLVMQELETTTDDELALLDGAEGE